MAVADQQDQYDFASSEAKEMVADRERSWQAMAPPRLTKLLRVADEF